MVRKKKRGKAVIVAGWPNKILYHSSARHSVNTLSYSYYFAFSIQGVKVCMLSFSYFSSTAVGEVDRDYESNFL